MSKYFLTRLLLFIPTLLLIVGFALMVFHAAPNDPVESLMAIDGYERGILSEETYKKQYSQISKNLNLDLPKFYFSIVPSYYPNDLHTIRTKRDRDRAITLLKHHNDWGDVSAFLKEASIILKNDTDADTKEFVDVLLNKTRPTALSGFIKETTFAEQKEQHASLVEMASKIGQKKKSLFALPKLSWHGASCQYHKWIVNFFTGTMGRSSIDGRPVLQKIRNALTWTFVMVLTSLMLALLLSIPLGIFSSYKEDSLMVKIITNFFYFIYSMPLFWFATLMVVFFTNAQYGWWTNIFPGVGLTPYSGGDSVLSKIFANAQQLVLPIFCLVLSSIAYLSRIIRTSIVSESTQQYKVTALIKGLNRKSTYLKHLLPNALLPLVTIIAGVLPASLAGSLVIEVIFNIPGIGRLLYDAILGNDLFVISAIVLLVGFATIVSYLIGDLLYNYLNPKIRFRTSNA